MKPSSEFNDFRELIEILRRECPWDRKQTHESIRENLIEEAYEAVSAIDQKDDEELKKELGDLLLHVFFHSRIAEERDAFNIEDVVLAISEKLIHRHPHVFSDGEARTSEEVARNWEKLKKREGKRSLLDWIPPALPALIRARRMQEKASGVGFDWPEWKQAWEKLEEELSEWRNALESPDTVARMEEYGDLLFSLVNVGRLLGLNAEDALRGASDKFERRFRYVEEQLGRAGRDPSGATLEEMDRFWEQAKKEE